MVVITFMLIEMISGKFLEGVLSPILSVLAIATPFKPSVVSVLPLLLWEFFLSLAALATGRFAPGSVSALP